MGRIYAKVLALSLLLAASAACTELLIAPIWRAYRDNRAAIAELRGQLAHYRRVSAGRGEAEGLRRRLAAHAEREQLTLAAPNSGRAAAALQEAVKSLVDAAGGRLTSTRMLPVEQKGGFQRMVARVRLQADTDSLGAVLYALEGHFPYLFLDELSIVSRGASRPRAGSSEPSIPLDVGVDVITYLPVDGPTQESGG